MHTKRYMSLFRKLVQSRVGAIPRYHSNLIENLTDVLMGNFCPFLKFYSKKPNSHNKCTYNINHCVGLFKLIKRM